MGTDVQERLVHVLDHGFVRLVDYMGGDDRIVQAARVSFGQGTKTKREDGKLIDYLWRNRHTSPFEQVVFTFHMKMPIFVARQIVRHRTARLNEVSGRYSVIRTEAYVPERSRIQAQDNKNRQGSAEALSYEVQTSALYHIEAAYSSAFDHYRQLLEMGVSREVARTVLPVGVYTEWYWQIDLHNLFHFLRLRLDEHAQWETRKYAEALSKLATPIAPIAFASFRKRTLGLADETGSNEQE